MKSLLKKFLFVLLFIPQVFPQGYKLVWSDEFNDTTLNVNNWSYETGNSNGWGNNELEYYTGRKQNCSVQDSVLTITALKENYNGFDYTSARIKTQNKFSFKYGKVEARIKLPFGAGMWPAFWMLGDNISTVGWPACGEIDIMEMIGGQGRENTAHGSAHWGGDYTNTYTLSSGTFADDYHIFDVVWTPTQIVWHVDGITYSTLDITSLSAFQNKFFIILNLAVGGAWPGNPDNSTAFPQTMKVDYIRVYQDTTAFPSVSLTSPENNSTFAPGSNITLTANASSSNGMITKVDFYQDAVKIGETFVSPYQMTWNNVLAGNYKITCVAYSSKGLTTLSDTTTIIVGSNAITSPYAGTPANIPGTIEAENYDLGGQNKAYYDSDTQNTGGLYRPYEGVDIEQCTDTGGGYDVGWTQNNEWLNYTINVSDSGTYQIDTRVASASGGGSLHFEIDGTDVTGIITVPSTGDWQTWATVQSKNFNLSAGIHQLKLYINSAGFNINKIEVYPPNSSPSINMIYPEGGENFNAGNIVEIKWRSEKIDQVLIGFSTNGGKTWSLVQTDIDASFGVYRWLIPPLTSADCQLKVVDKTDLYILDTVKSPFTIGVANSIKDREKPPVRFSLNQNYPNPFNPATTIKYSVPTKSFVTLKIFDLLGREIKTLVYGEKSAGIYQTQFDATSYTSGIYFYRIQAGNFVDTKKMIVLK
jgi:beta-glucanase (GH16 family)